MRAAFEVILGGSSVKVTLSAFMKFAGGSAEVPHWAVALGHLEPQGEFLLKLYLHYATGHSCQQSGNTRPPVN